MSRQAAAAVAEGAAKDAVRTKGTSRRFKGPTRSPSSVILEALHTHGSMTRAELWKIAAESAAPPKSKRHMKRVVRELVRRDVAVAVADTRRIQEKLAGSKKMLAAKHVPPFLFKIKGERLYRPEPKAEKTQAQATTDAKQVADKQ